MKCPETLTLVRHGVSVFNEFRAQKVEKPLYQQFMRAFDANPDSQESYRLALDIDGQFSLGFSDHDTPLAETAGEQVQRMAKNLRKRIQPPDVIFVSPYKRAQQTLDRMMDGWPDLSNVQVVDDERLRERDFGLALLYNDWRVFNVLHPEQRDLRQMQGPYWYRYPQGENVHDIRRRSGSWMKDVARDYSEQNVFAVTHQLPILTLRTNIEGLSTDQLIQLDQQDPPINAGVTTYRNRPNEGRGGHLVLDVYNVKLY